MDENGFEKFPGSRIEKVGERSVPAGQDFEKSFAEGGVPEYKGDLFGNAREENNYYGETVDDDNKQNEGIEDDGGSEYQDDFAKVTTIINYGFDAAARKYGPELVMQRINDFDPSGSQDPIGDLFRHLGVDTPEEMKDVRNEAQATKDIEAEFKEQFDMPKDKEKSREGAIVAIAEVKELMSEVEGADPAYESLRQGAKTAGMGYYEYAVKEYGSRGLVELFQVLKAQKDEANKLANQEQGLAEENNDLAAGNELAR